MLSFKVPALLLLFSGFVLSDPLIQNILATQFPNSLVENVLGSNENEKFGILNGNKTNILHHPYQAAILLGNLTFGSGAILDKNYIVTFAIFPYYASYFKVVVGENHPTEHNSYEIEDIILHPLYSLGTDYYVSILKLKKPLKFSKKVKPIAIATEPPKHGSSAVVSGWGITDLQNFTSPKTLVQLEQTLLTREYCQDFYLASTVSNTTFCAYKSEEQRPTLFDYGDPLVQNNKLVGIFIGDFASPIVCIDITACPSIYTDVTLLSSWISETVNGAETMIN